MPKDATPKLDAVLAQYPSGHVEHACEVARLARNLEIDLDCWFTNAKRLQKQANELDAERTALRRLLFDVRHQRIDTIGRKVEDYLLEHNEQLLLRITEQTKGL